MVMKMQWNSLAICYENGEETEKEFRKKPFIGIQKAAENGDENAMNTAENGYENAMNSLAIYYENGEGTEKNLEKAFYWYQKAAEKW
ncbi:unnamed protein product [Rhizophagus irregularis]|nr:unnamed protein product [Rhizophagus irregularis]